MAEKEKEEPAYRGRRRGRNWCIEEEGREKNQGIAAGKKGKTGAQRRKKSEELCVQRKKEEEPCTYM